MPPADSPSLHRISAEHKSELWALYSDWAVEIGNRLDDFRNVPPGRYFYELCYCLMTPQSSALQCARVADELERRFFLDRVFDPEPLLRSFDGGYVRFHKTKAQRLLKLRNGFEKVQRCLETVHHEKKTRHELVRLVNGLGYKEASHFLRNIGRTGVTIVDRHILRNLFRLNLIHEIPRSISIKRYIELEQVFENLAGDLNIPADELDLLLWKRETGFVLK